MDPDANLRDYCEAAAVGDYERMAELHEALHDWLRYGCGRPSLDKLTDPFYDAGYAARLKAGEEACNC